MTAAPYPPVPVPACQHPPVRLLLINPKAPESFWNFKWAVERVLPGKRAVNPPLGLATLAALCPADWQVRIVDENIESVPLAPEADLVGIGGMAVQFTRQKELLRYYRARGYHVVAGGSYASLCPEKYEALADTVICGEAEYVWKQYCDDFEKGCPSPLYRESGTVDLQDSPVPRFELLKMEKYSTATLQYSRGCPYLCEFCDIIVMFGRKPRYKRIEQIECELERLRSLGVRNAFFVDDNLIGNKSSAKALLKFLAGYQRLHGNWFNFGSEVSLNVAQDAELLALLRDANFNWLFIGIESTDEQTLRDTRKLQNVREPALEAVKRINSYGIDVMAGFIIGFDADTEATFERQYQFIVRSGILAAMVGLITALPRTPLYERLAREGRLIESAGHGENTRAATNVLPKSMSYDAMVESFRSLYRRLLSDRTIAERIINKHRQLATPVYVPEYRFRERMIIVKRLLTRGIAAGGATRVYHFLRSLPWRSPRNISLALVDWIAALSMRDYVDRHFAEPNERIGRKFDRLTAALRDRLAAHLRQGAISLSLQTPDKGAPVVSISLKGWLRQDFFARARGPLKALLKRTPATITFRIEEIGAMDMRHLRRLLKRLERYGDRIFISVHERLLNAAAVDSSVFNLLLEPRAS